MNCRISQGESTFELDLRTASSGPNLAYFPLYRYFPLPKQEDGQRGVAQLLTGTRVSRSAGCRLTLYRQVTVTEGLTERGQPAPILQPARSHSACLEHWASPCPSGLPLPILARRRDDICGFQNIFKAGKTFL